MKPSLTVVAISAVIFSGLLLPTRPVLAVDAVASAASAAVSLPSAADIQAVVDRVRKNLVYLHGGTFQMGDWGNEDGLPYEDEKSSPLHSVTLSGFSMLKYKVTYQDFDVFTAATGHKKIVQEIFYQKERLPNFPAASNWYGAKAYCEWLGKVSGLPFDLPTEAQWEYAARSGGKKVLYATDNGKLEEGRNYPSSEQSSKMTGDDLAMAIPIGLYPPNPIGIYGLQEIGQEWVGDWFDYYSEKMQTNPKGPATGTNKVWRGEFGSPTYSLTITRYYRPPQGGHPKSTEAQRSVLDGLDYSDNPGVSFRCVVSN